MKRALITGITGQLGSYLAELLLTKDYEVYGLVRRTSTPSTARIGGLLDAITLIEGDLTDYSSLVEAINRSHPDEVYNCAAQSHVGTSFGQEDTTHDITGWGAARLFRACRLGLPQAYWPRIYQASTSEMFGNQPGPQSEATILDPQSPYGCAKVFAHHTARFYRRAYGMFIACGINFNFESERRGELFVTRKITKAIAAIKHGEATEVRLGNLAARRDWSHAEDTARAAWMMLQQPEPDDYVIGSEQTRTVQEFAEAAFNYAGLDWQQYVKRDVSQLRPLDVHHLQACAAKAHAQLGWFPTIDFSTLVRRMVDHDNDLAEERLSRHR